MPNFSEAFPGRLLEDVYEFDRVFSWVRNSNLKCIALQFSNELLADACEVSKKIEKNCNVQTFIMGDNNFGSTCCVDEHTASIISVNGIIHFGHACLSPHSLLPVLYVYGNQQLPEDNLLHAINGLLSEVNNIFISCDVAYYQSLKNLYLEKMDKKKVFLCKLDDYENVHADVDAESATLVNSPTDESAREEQCFLHIGNDIELATNIIMKRTSSRYYFYDPLSSKLEDVSRVKNLLARKRYFLVEKIKNSSLIGILAGTLEVGNSVKMIERLKAMIAHSGKRSCVIIIGKVSPAKLANFPEVDCFVMVACRENTLYDAKEYFCPIVTPYELAVALNYTEWTNSYETDFHKLLKDLKDISLETGDTDQFNSDDISGNMQISVPNPLTIGMNYSSNLEDGSRIWRGLEPGVHETTVKKAEIGRSGLAMRYSTVGDSAHQSCNLEEA